MTGRDDSVLRVNKVATNTLIVLRLISRNPRNSGPADDRGDTEMMEIFLIQLLAAALGALSTAWADRSFSGARIGQRQHAFWVSASIAVICVPVVSWTAMVFLGSGLLGQLVAGTLVGAIFLWVYCNLPKSREVRKFGLRLPGAGGAAPFPPASRLDG